MADENTSAPIETKQGQENLTDDPKAKLRVTLMKLIT